MLLFSEWERCESVVKEWGCKGPAYRVGLYPGQSKVQTVSENFKIKVMMLREAVRPG